jgi:hypothetical protein
MHAWPESGRRPGAEERRDQGPHLSRPPPTVVSAAHLSISRGTQHALLAEGPADAFVSGGSFPWPCVWCGDGGTSRCWCATRRNIAGGGGESEPLAACTAGRVPGVQWAVGRPVPTSVVARPIPTARCVRTRAPRRRSLPHLAQQGMPKLPRRPSAVYRA